MNSRWAELLADFCGVEAALEEIRRRRAGRKKNDRMNLAIAAIMLVILIFMFVEDL